MNNKRAVTKMIFARRNRPRTDAARVIMNSTVPVTFFSSSVPEDGVVGRFMAPTSMRVTDVRTFSHIEEFKEKGPVTLAITKINSIGEQGFTIQLKDGHGGYPDDFSLGLGDRLVMTVLGTPEDRARVKELWICFATTGVAAKPLQAMLKEIEDAGVFDQPDGVILEGPAPEHVRSSQPALPGAGQ